MYKVTNKAKDVRKFRDRFLGKDIFVEPKQFALTKRPPEENEIWKVEKIEESEKKQKLNLKEVKKNDSSSSR